MCSLSNNHRQPLLWFISQHISLAYPWILYAWIIIYLFVSAFFNQQIFLRLIHDESDKYQYFILLNFLNGIQFVWIKYLLICSPVDKYLGWFQFRAILNKVYKIFCGQKYSFLLNKYLVVVLLDHSLLKMDKFFQSKCWKCSITSNVWECQFFYSNTNIQCCHFSNFSYFSGCGIILRF